MKESMKILIFNPFGIGDVIFSTPVIREIHKKYPNATLYYVCNKRTKFLLENDPYLADIFIYEKDDLRELFKKHPFGLFKELISFSNKIRKLKFDVMVDMTLNHQASLFMMLSGIRKRIGLNYKNRGRFLTSKIKLDGFNDKNVALYYLDLLKFLGIDSQDGKVELFLSKQMDDWAKQWSEKTFSNERFIAVCPGGGTTWGKDAASRQWPVEKYSKLIDKIIQKYNASIVVFGNKNEICIADEILAGIKGNVINMAGKTTLPEFLALLKMAFFVICNDGGPMHMAVGVKAKVVSIFGPVDEKVYGPFKLEDHMIITSEISCRPCYKNFRLKECSTYGCIKDIEVDKVFNAVCGMYEKLG
ncbi:MAG: glycosyltransferase family 9 protein [Candidatus Omnitrophica bacterium]|nr:glycosyltransferase family 9 protein [Candidatus Omnitrophota bacterium]